MSTNYSAGTSTVQASAAVCGHVVFKIAMFAFLIGCFLSLPVLGQDSEKCEIIHLEEPPWWLSSAAWFEDRGLIVSDKLRKEISFIPAFREVSLKSGESSLWPTRSKLQFMQEYSNTDIVLRAATLRVAGDQLWIKEDVSSRIFKIDGKIEDGLISFESIDVGKRRKVIAPDGGLELGGVYSFVPFDDLGILALAEFVGKGRQLAYFGIDKTSSGVVEWEVLAEIDVSDASTRALYSRDIDYIASIGDLGYFLHLEENPYIGEVRRGQQGERRLVSFPEGFTGRPDLSVNGALRLRGGRKATAVYREMERVQMVTGLFSWEGGLYIVTKSEIRNNGLTDWWVIEVDTSTGEEKGRLHLPSSAAHLTVAPGSTQWAFFEKGQVRGIREGPYMWVNSILLTPSSWLRNLDSAGDGHRVRNSCAERSY